MADSMTELDLSDYLDLGRRRKYLIGALALLVVGVAVALSWLQTPLYRATARVRVDAASSSNILDETVNLSSNVRARNLQNEVEFANSDRVQQRASEAFGGSISADSAASDNSDTLTFTAVDTDPVGAALIANTFAEAYVAERSAAAGERYIAAVDVLNQRLADISESRLLLETELESTPDASSVQIQIDSLDGEEARLRGQLNQIDVLSSLNSSASVEILKAAEAPTSYFSPSWVRNIGLALVTGLIVGIGAALIVESLDNTILNRRDLETASDGLPVLAVIPPPHQTRLSRRRERRLVTARTGAFTEGFRSLRSAFELGVEGSDEIRTVLITSANAAEGKSTVAAHLALTFARSGLSVVIIDADMHNPTQHDLFSVANENGLADELSRAGQAEILTEQASGEGLLSVVPAGSSGTPPAELLGSDRAEEFVEKLAGAYDLVIIDAPPLRPVADTLPIAHLADATLLVAMRGQTNAVEIEQAMELLARAQTRPIGAVLCGADETETGYGYGYGKKSRSS